MKCTYAECVFINRLARPAKRDIIKTIIKWHNHAVFKAHHFTERLICTAHIKQKELPQNKTNL